MSSGIHIFIGDKQVSNKTGGKTNVVNEEGNGFDSPNQTIAKGINTIQSIGRNQLVMMGIQSAKQIGNNAINQYANNTGDYFGQTNIDTALSNIGVATGIGSSALAGYMAGGVVGMAVAVTVKTTSIIVNGIIDYNNMQREYRRNNQNTTFNSALIGSILVDGNR